MSQFAPYLRFLGCLAVLMVAASMPLCFFGYRWLPHTSRLCTFFLVLLLSVQGVITLTTEEVYNANLNIVCVVLALLVVPLTWKLPTITEFCVGALVGASLVIEVFEFTGNESIWVFLFALVAGGGMGFVCRRRRAMLICAMAFNGSMMLVTAISLLLLRLPENFAVIYFGGHALIFLVGVFIQYKFTAKGIDHHGPTFSDVVLGKNMIETPPPTVYQQV
ncbi:hypothetical protein THRCLA_21714 [Thraustotheca clavata]|uniref:TM7S3/TM198-like domain-containing protein n=1 Tax=Thraustotheca clavata TaxID=74557 RepID=A0A1V9ZQD6_9STRA|nr:hypothetical protein THRCLA_21714 [Thraustotheca clavata]